MEQAAKIMNRLGKEKTPFLFVIDFAMRKPLIVPLDEIDATEILFDVNGQTNARGRPETDKTLEFNATPVSKEVYCKAFQTVQHHIRRGDSFLLNLTMPSTVETNYSLREIFYRSEARYKLWLRDKLVVFSPEIFVKVNNGIISSYPMKGTMDASLPDAAERLLASEKELAEHYTIVDLIRNDLSMVSENVEVVRFRYIDRLKTHKGALLQMSSEIRGTLPDDYSGQIGDILLRLLPAGSISGAPKKKTVDIICSVENYDRGFYTGIFGIFDGINLDSGVMIRYMEQTNTGMVYKSGGGITANSICEEEYRELIDKIYVPTA
jgi:para-aminobenzoate synthetase component 1